MNIAVTKPVAREFLAFMIRRHREDFPMNRAELARRVGKGVTRELIVKIEHAEVYYLRHDQLKRLVHVLKMRGENQEVVFQLRPSFAPTRRERQESSQLIEVSRYPNHRLVSSRG